ncbi:DUF4004 family protein [Paenibacillus alkalitolerans]|uniref:DUF4004 family protein n=1 Tax=Paenibacillus alkalitolerans TaxID=2799335 RepID=UPI0018F2EFAF|nr:DUF4004 family protein [Paenibacillus alkalitolerans]
MTEDKDLLSKKELLRLTGISYGQLYRWKRQNLIPEAWFIKQSSFTGQETFFPKHKILERIDAIIDLKDKYSLDELARHFNPDVSEKLYPVEEVLRLGYPEDMVRSYLHASVQEYFTFHDLLFLELFYSLIKEERLTKAEVENLYHSVHSWAGRFDRTGMQVVVCEENGRHFVLLVPEGTLLLDPKLQLVKALALEDLTKAISDKLKIWETV